MLIQNLVLRMCYSQLDVRNHPQKSVVIVWKYV